MVARIFINYRREDSTATAGRVICVVVPRPHQGEIAERILSNPANTSGRFFAWFHFFDPHAQYVPHQSAPNTELANAAMPTKALYDGEVRWVDDHIARLVTVVEELGIADRTPNLRAS